MAAIIPAITKLSHRVIRVLGCNPGPMTLQGTNTYLLGTGKRRILIDAGDSDVDEYQKHLTQVIKSERADIAHIIITHWHHDHIGGVKDIYNILAKDCQVWKHKKSSEDAPDNEMPTTIPIHWLKNGQELSVDGATVKIHHTPGHTTDHIVLMLLEDNILLSGDCILGEGTAVFEDLYSYMNSLTKILNLKPSLIYPGHGNVIEDPHSSISYYIKHRNQREEQILDVLKSNKDIQISSMDIVKIIYKDIDPNLWPAADYNVNHHLEKLYKENKIIKQNHNDELMWQYPPISTL